MPSLQCSAYPRNTGAMRASTHHPLRSHHRSPRHRRGGAGGDRSAMIPFPFPRYGKAKRIMPLSECPHVVRTRCWMGDACSSFPVTFLRQRRRKPPPGGTAATTRPGTTTTDNNGQQRTTAAGTTTTGTGFSGPGGPRNNIVQEVVGLWPTPTYRRGRAPGALPQGFAGPTAAGTTTATNNNNNSSGEQRKEAG